MDEPTGIKVGDVWKDNRTGDEFEIAYVTVFDIRVQNLTTRRKSWRSRSAVEKYMSFVRRAPGKEQRS